MGYYEWFHTSVFSIGCPTPTCRVSPFDNMGWGPLLVEPVHMKKWRRGGIIWTILKIITPDIPPLHLGGGWGD